jgi:cell division transport system permease protein
MDNIVRNTIANVKRERLLSVTNIFTMTMTFLILGIFITVIVISQSILRTLEQQAQVTIFFKDDFTEDRILELENNLSQDPRIHSINYVSKEDAYKIFTEINKDDPALLESVTSSILPASLEIRANDISDLPKLADEFNKLDGVEEVRFFADVISRFRQVSTIAYIVGFVLVFVFLVISYSVILSTLRTTINSKGTEFEIMKLVGATNKFVKSPLIYQGMFYGLVSSFFSGAFLVVIIALLNYFKFIPGSLGLGFLPNFSFSSLAYSLVLWLLLIISGLAVGFFGSSHAVKKYLKY